MPGKVNKLFKWCKKVTEPYDNVDLVNMTTSWKSGLAFCAIIHQFRPDLIDFDSLSEDDPYRNNKIAFHTAEKELGIPALLDAEDLVKMPIPDRFSIATYVAQFYDKFKDLPEIGRPKGSRINASDATISQKSGISARKEDLQSNQMKTGLSNMSMSLNSDIPTDKNTSGVMDTVDLTVKVTYSKDTSDHIVDDNLDKSHALLDQGRDKELAEIPSLADGVNNNAHTEVHLSRDTAHIFYLNNTLAEKKEYIYISDKRRIELPENSTQVAMSIQSGLGEYQAHGGHVRLDTDSVEEDNGVGLSSDYVQNVDSHQNYIDETSHPQSSNYESNVECIDVSLNDRNTNNSEQHVLTMDTFSGSFIKVTDSNRFAQSFDDDGGEIDDRSRDVDENMDEISDNITEKVVGERDLDNAWNWGILSDIEEDSESDSSTQTWKVLNTAPHQNYYSGNYGDDFSRIIKTEKDDLENRVEGKGDNIDEDNLERKISFPEMKFSGSVTEKLDNTHETYGFDDEESNSIGVALVDMIGEYPDIVNESEDRKGNCSVQNEVESERKISVLEMTIMDSMTETISNKDEISELEKKENESYDLDHTSSSFVHVIAGTTQATDKSQTGASVEVILPLNDVSCHIAEVQTVVTGSMSHKTGHEKKSESQVISTLHNRFDAIPKDEASVVIGVVEVADNLQNNANSIEIPPPQFEACIRHICEMASNSESGSTSMPTSSCEFKSSGENVFEAAGKSENVGEDIFESILISNHEKMNEMNMCEKADNFHGQDNGGRVLDSMSVSEIVDQSEIHAILLLAEEVVASVMAGSVQVLTEEKGAGKEHNGTNETPDERLERISTHGHSSDLKPNEQDSDLESKQNADGIDTIISKTDFMYSQDISTKNSQRLIGTEMTSVDGIAESLQNYADSIIEDCDHVDTIRISETPTAGEACSVVPEIILATDYKERTHVPEFSHQAEAADVIMAQGDNIDVNGVVLVDHGIKTMPLSSDQENSQYLDQSIERKRTSLVVKLSYGDQSEDNHIQERKDNAIDGVIGAECEYLVKQENVAELESNPIVIVKEVESQIKSEVENTEGKIIVEDKGSHFQYEQNSDFQEDKALPSINSIKILQLVMHDNRNYQDSINRASVEGDLRDNSSFEQNIEPVLEPSCQELEFQSDNQVDKADYSSGPAVFSSCLEAKEILTNAVTKENKPSLNIVRRNQEDTNAAIEILDGTDGVLVSRGISEKNDAFMFCGFEHPAVNNHCGSEIGSNSVMSGQGDSRFGTEEMVVDVGAFDKKGDEMEFAELDLDIIKKAAVMAQQMAARLSSENKAKQEEEENIRNSDAKESKQEKGSKDYNTGKNIFEDVTDESTDQKANISLEEAVEKHEEEETLDKPKVSAAVRRIQYWTRPARFDGHTADKLEEDSLDNLYAQDFKRKMKLFSRAECNNGEPPQANSDYPQKGGRVSDIFTRKLKESASLPMSSNSSDSLAVAGAINCTPSKGNMKSVLQQFENKGNEKRYIHKPFEVIKTEGLMEEEVYKETKQWPLKAVSNKEPREMKLTVQPVFAKFEMEEEVSENQVKSTLRTRESLTKTPDKTPRKVSVDIHPVMEQLQKGREKEKNSELELLNAKGLVRKQDFTSDGVQTKLDVLIQPVTAKVDHSYPGKELLKVNMPSNEPSQVLRRTVSDANHQTGNTPWKDTTTMHPVVAKPWSPPVTQTRALVMPSAIFSKNSTSFIHPKAELLNPVKVPPLPVSAKAIREKIVLPSNKVSSESVSSNDLLRRNSSETKSPPPFIVSVRPFSAKLELEQETKAAEKTVEATEENMLEMGFISPNSDRFALHSPDKIVTSDVTDQNKSLSSPGDTTQSHQRNVVSSGQSWFQRRNKSTNGFDKPGNISHVQSCLQKQIHKTGLEDTSKERKTCFLKSSSYSEADQSNSQPDESRQAKLLRKTLSDAPSYTAKVSEPKTPTSKVFKSTKSIYETIKAYQGNDSESEIKRKLSVTEANRFSQDTASPLASPTYEQGKSFSQVSSGKDSFSVDHGDQRMDSENQNGCQEEKFRNQIQAVPVLFPNIKINHVTMPSSHVISTVPEILSKNKESSPRSEGLNEKLQPSRSTIINGKAKQEDCAIETLQSETFIDKNINVFLSEQIHSEREVTGLEASQIEMKTSIMALEIGMETDQNAANVGMEIEEKAAKNGMEIEQMVANNGMETDQEAVNIGMETDHNTVNIGMETDQNVASIEMETEQKAVNINMDQKVAYIGLEIDQKVANTGLETGDKVSEIKLKIEKDVFRKYTEIEENASVLEPVMTEFKKDGGEGLLDLSGSSDEANNLSRTVSKIKPNSIDEKASLDVKNYLGVVKEENISDQEVETTVSCVQSSLSGEVVDCETKKLCEVTQIEVKAFSHYEPGLSIENEFSEEKMDECLCSDKVKLNEANTSSVDIFALCTEEINLLSKSDDTLDGEIGVNKLYASDSDHSGEDSIYKKELILPADNESEDTLLCSDSLIWREIEDETSDLEQEKFIIGREKDPSKSEVARLIQQSLDLDRRREEMRIRDLEQMQALHDHFKPRDEVLEHEHLRRMSEGSDRMEKEDTLDDDDSDNEEEVDEEEESQREEGEEELVEEVVEEVSVSEEYNAGEATPMSMPSGIDTDNSVSSPEENGKVAIEVFDLEGSSSESVSPDMEAQALFIKLKEVQTKNSVLEAELAKLKARIIMLEKEESHRKQYEKKCEDMAMRLRDVEKSLENAMKEKNHYQDMLEGSQGQYIGLEKKMKGSYTALEKKYHKAKKLIKDYQLREKDLIQERESLLQQQIEKDQQYNALFKSLKDRIIQLEGDLNETPTSAGMSSSSINGQKVDTSVIIKATTTAVSSAPKVFTSSPIRSLSGADTESISSGSDASSLEPVTSPDLDDESKKLEVSLKDKMELEAVPQTTLLDTSASRSKGQLGSAGGLAARRPPTKKLKSSDSSESEKGDLHDPVENRAAESESGLETWIKHDSDSTVRKNDTKKRKAAQPSPGKESSQDFPSYPDTPPPPPPPTQPPPLLQEGDTASEKSQSRTDEEASEETLSQTSYDPANPNFKGLDSEIPDSVSIDTTDTLETQESGSSGTASSGTGNKKSSGKSISLPKLPFKFVTGGSKDKGNGGIVLLSSKSLEASNDAPRSEGGITLISKKALNTGYDFDGASINSDVSSGYMVSESDLVSKGSSFSLNISGTPAVQESPASQNRQNQFQSCAIAEWNIEHVCHWLIGLEMEKYSSLFSEKNITGSQLLLLDGNRLKTLGISDSKDRELLKKKIKEIKTAAEKERKQQEKEKKLLEKEQKLKEKEQKKQKKK